ARPPLSGGEHLRRVGREGGREDLATHAVEGADDCAARGVADGDAAPATRREHEAPVAREGDAPRDVVIGAEVTALLEVAESEGIGLAERPGNHVLADLGEVAALELVLHVGPTGAELEERLLVGVGRDEARDGRDEADSARRLGRLDGRRDRGLHRSQPRVGRLLDPLLDRLDGVPRLFGDAREAVATPPETLVEMGPRERDRRAEARLAPEARELAPPGDDVVLLDERLRLGEPEREPRRLVAHVREELELLGRERAGPQPLTESAGLKEDVSLLRGTLEASQSLVHGQGTK